MPRGKATGHAHFTPSEYVAIAEALRPAEAARERQAEGQRAGAAALHGGKLPPSTPDVGKTRDKVARYVGVSGRTLERVRRAEAIAPKLAERKAALILSPDNKITTPSGRRPGQGRKPDAAVSEHEIADALSITRAAYHVAKAHVAAVEEFPDLAPLPVALISSESDEIRTRSAGPI